MISFRTKKEYLKFPKAAFYLIGILSLLIFSGNVFPMQAHAQVTTPAAPVQADTPPDPNTLLPGQSSGGWTCGAASLTQTSVYNCTNPNTDTAECTSIAPDTSAATNPIENIGNVFNPIATGGAYVCQVHYPDGSQSNISVVATQSQSTNTNSQGQTTSQTTLAPVNTLQQQTGAATANITNSLGQCLNGNIIGSIAGCIISAVAYLLLQIAATILGFVGLLFNWVVTVTVFEFGLYFANSPGMLVAWGILRDIGNIVILFGFILMGIMMILDLESLNVRKALPRLLIFAVLLNFSLFATEAVVDVANSLSAAFYQATGNGTTSGGVNCAGQSALTNTQCTEVGIAGTIISATGLTTVWNLNNDTDADAETQLKTITSGDGAVIMILLALFVSIAAIVLLAGAIMLFIRAITLALLLVISPLGFAGMAIPPFKKMADNWWKKLIGEAFFAPVFLLMIFVALKITSIIQIQGGQGGATFLQAITPGSVNMGLIFLFFLIFGFMIAALVISKSLSATGADLAISTSTKFVGGATLGTAGFVGRRTFGRGANSAEEALGKTRFGRSQVGQFLRGGLKQAAGSSFDVRATKPFQSLQKVAKVDLGGAAGKGGYQKIVHDAEERDKKYAKTLQNSEEEKQLLKNIEKAINNQGVADRAELSVIDTDQRAARIPIEAAVTARQRDVAVARAGGNKADIATAELGLNNALRIRDELLKDQVTARKAVEDRQKALIDVEQNKAKKIRERPQTEYAYKLDPTKNPDSWEYGLEPRRGVTAGPRSGQHAAEAILKDLGKNETQKLIDALSGVQAGLNNNQNAGGNQGGAAAPAGGGGRPAGPAAPAGGGGGGH